MKEGLAFQEVVAEIIRGLNPTIEVREEQWTMGPDGRRDKDVEIITKQNGKLVKVLIECKDYHPKSKIGISYIDALESKSRDLQADLTILCSNAGFTQPAIKKAIRVGIGLIGVMKKADDRIRYLVTEKMYVRDINYDHINYSLFSGPDEIDLSQATSNEILFNDKLVATYALRIVNKITAMNPIVNGRYSINQEFVKPLLFNIKNNEVYCTKIIVNFRITGNWHEHVVKIDATNAIYDWVSKKLMYNTYYSRKFSILDIDVFGNKKIIRIPPGMENPHHRIDVKDGENFFGIFTATGADDTILRQPNPSLEEYVVQEDKDMYIDELTIERKMSSKYLSTTVLENL
jgi:hypothetical protein